MHELTDREKWELAVFFKRLTFNDVLEHADPGTKENEYAQVYTVLEAIRKLQKELANQGYNPR